MHLHRGFIAVAVRHLFAALHYHRNQVLAIRLLLRRRRDRLVVVQGDLFKAVLNEILQLGRGCRLQSRLKAKGIRVRDIL